jgi:chromosome segregation ATPase
MDLNELKISMAGSRNDIEELQDLLTKSQGEIQNNVSEIKKLKKALKSKGQPSAGTYQPPLLKIPQGYTEINDTIEVMQFDINDLKMRSEELSDNSNSELKRLKKKVRKLEKREPQPEKPSSAQLTPEDLQRINALQDTVNRLVNDLTAQQKYLAALQPIISNLQRPQTVVATAPAPQGVDELLQQLPVIVKQIQGNSDAIVKCTQNMNDTKKAVQDKFQENDKFMKLLQEQIKKGLGRGGPTIMFKGGNHISPEELTAFQALAHTVHDNTAQLEDIAERVNELESLSKMFEVQLQSQVPLLGVLPLSRQIKKIPRCFIWVMECCLQRVPSGSLCTGR